MIRHVVMLRFTDDASEEARAAVGTALAEMPEKIPTIRAYRFGSDLGLGDGNWDFVVVADFDDEEGYLTYSTHDAHIAAIVEHIKPILVDRAAVQYEI
jgi:hypothetical protein